ncbi:hypothetical protein ACJIZ3_006557 [Penstemon smallii]|uniref:BHLH domain-containing protein n=1 Tax=Penstemon smallii TaxID=265156 RepID=A0ABD3S853_9LAMI
MSQEFQGGVCGGKWWNSSTNLFRSSPCTSAINGIGAFGGWPSHDDQLLDMKTTTRSSSDSAGSVSDGSSSIVLQDHDSTFQMMGINLSSSTITNHNWNQDLMIDSGRSEETYSHLLQEATPLNSSMNYGQQNGFDCTQINKQWSSNNFSQDSSINNSSSHGLVSSFPMNSASFSYNLGPQSLLDNQLEMNYSSATNYNQMINSNDFLTSLPKESPMIKPGLQFSNNTAFWNAMDEDLKDVRTKSRFMQSSVNSTKPSPSIFTAKYRNEEMGEISSSAAKKDKSEPAVKRPRIETPSPLPTFKVRKEKMGDRVTALQQLVSPFGKTDTASVLHEAIEYIKFLHDQVSVLSSPYMKNGSPPLQREIKDQEGLNIVQGLKSRGLCLVPVSSTFPVTSDHTGTDFWTPTFGGSFR